MRIICFVWLIAFTFSRYVGIHARYFDRVFALSQTSISSCEGKYSEVQRVLFANKSLYVGATNTILQLTPDLTISHQFITGPGNDSDTCFASLVCGTLSQLCAGSVSCNDNFNTLLLAYRGRLLACGTLYEACDLLTLNDISVRLGSEADLKCLDRLDSLQKYLRISSRDLNRRLVGSIYVNKMQIDSNILYLGKFHEDIKALLAPSSVHTYFTLIEESNNYVPQDRKPVYHFSWTNNDYGYMLWTTSSTTTPQLKLSRYCNRIVSELTRSEVGVTTELNNGERSYTEITLQCNVSGAVLTELISAKVYFDKLFLLYRSNNLVIICSSNVSALNKRFNFIREQCWNVNNSPLVQPIVGIGRCRSQSVYNEEWSTCGLPSPYAVFFKPVEATTPLLLNNDLKLPLQPEQSATSFVIVQANEMFSSFIGTSSGTIIKIRLSAKNRISEVISSEESNPILDSMVTDDSGEILFAATKNLIFRVAVSNCSQYRNCDQCLESQDIYCGWCVLQGRCTRKNSCDASDQPERWIKPTSNSSLCPRITNQQPNNVSHDSGIITIRFVISGRNLLTSSSYYCQFSVGDSTNNFYSSSFQWIDEKSSAGNCQFDASYVNDLPQLSDYNNVTINLVYNNKAVLTTILQVFSCARIKEINKTNVCTSCTSSQWGCSWCTSTASCNYNPSCNQPIIEQSGCPRVTSINDAMSPISVGKSKTFTLNTKNIFQPFPGYKCRYTFCEKTIYSSAIIVNSSVAECTVSASELTCDVNNVTIQVFLVRSDDYVIDTISLASVQGTVFNCSINSRSCGSCMALHNQCVWCSMTSSCIVSSNCKQPITMISKCPSGKILSVSPLNGPLQGNTTVTIIGTNLGSTVTEISQVVIETVNCFIIPHLYVLSERVVCRTNAASENAGGRVTIHTTYGSPIRSSFVFQFKRVEALSFSPHLVFNRSPVTVEGRNLDVGSKAVLSIGSESINVLDCVNRSNSQFTCHNRQHQDLYGKTKLSLSIDGFKHDFPTLLEFVPIPSLESLIKPISVFAGVGGNVSFYLSSIDGLQKVDLKIRNILQECQIPIFWSPVSCSIPIYDQAFPSNVSRTSNGHLQDSFFMQLLLNDVHTLDAGTVYYYKDPIFFLSNFLPCKGTDYPDSTNIDAKLQGRNFDLVPLSTFQYRILFLPESTSDQIQCKAFEIKINFISCRLSLAQWNKYKYSKIKVKINIGKLEYEGEQQCPTDSTIIVAVSVILPVFLLLIGLIVCWFYWAGKRRRP